MINFFEKLLSLIYIQSCYFCRSTKDDSIICKKCLNKIHYMPAAVFREYYGIKTYACCIYDDIVKKLIKDLKYHNQKKLSHICAELISNYIKEIKLQGDYTIIPVPISKERLKERKYNHMDLIADNLKTITGFKTEKNFLLRIKDTQKQFKLHKQERIENIKGAFSVNSNMELPKETPLLVIDDITSTGITFKEIINTLKKSGYKNIIAIALSTPDIWN